MDRHWQSYSGRGTIQSSSLQRVCTRPGACVWRAPPSSSSYRRKTRDGIETLSTLLGLSYRLRRGASRPVTVPEAISLLNSIQSCLPETLNQCFGMSSSVASVMTGFSANLENTWRIGRGTYCEINCACAEIEMLLIFGDPEYSNQTDQILRDTLSGRLHRPAIFESLLNARPEPPWARTAPSSQGQPRALPRLVRNRRWRRGLAASVATSISTRRLPATSWTLQTM